MFQNLFVLQLTVIVLSEDFCQITPIEYSSFNLGDNLIVETHESNKTHLAFEQYWQYDYSTKKFIKSKVNFWQKYFIGLTFGITFDFELCNNGSEYCKLVNKANGLVLAVGLDRSANSRKFFAFRQNGESFTEIKDKSEMPWNWPPVGVDINKANILPNISEDISDYFSAVFNPLHRTMIVVIRLFTEEPVVFQMKTRQLSESGIWGKWQLQNIDVTAVFNGLFVINKTLYAISQRNSSNFIYQFNNDLSFVEKSSVKEFFNCDKPLKTTLELKANNSLIDRTSKPDTNGNIESKTSDLIIKTTSNTVTEVPNPVKSTTIKSKPFQLFEDPINSDKTVSQSKTTITTNSNTEINVIPSNDKNNCFNSLVISILLILTSISLVICF